MSTERGTPEDHPAPSPLPPIDKPRVEGHRQDFGPVWTRFVRGLIYWFRCYFSGFLFTIAYVLTSHAPKWTDVAVICLAVVIWSVIDVMMRSNHTLPPIENRVRFTYPPFDEAGYGIVRAEWTPRDGKVTMLESELKVLLIRSDRLPVTARRLREESRLIGKNSETFGRWSSDERA